MSNAELMRRDRIFYATMAIIATVIVFIGFAPSFFLAVINPSAKPLAFIYHIHGAMFAFFMLFYVFQCLLIVGDKWKLHRYLGMFGAVLGCLMIVMAWAVVIYTGRHGFHGPGSTIPDPRTAMAISFFDMFVFGPLFIGAIVYRNSPEIHKRLMTLAVTGGLIEAAIARTPWFYHHVPRQMALYMAINLAGPIYDLATRKRVHRAYLIGLIPILLLLPPIRFAIGTSKLWLEFASWLLNVVQI